MKEFKIEDRCEEPCCEAPFCRIWVEMKDVISDEERERVAKILEKDKDCPLFKE